MNDIKEYQTLMHLKAIFQRVKQLSWTIDQTDRRYPAPEALTKEEIIRLSKMYLALGLDLQQIVKDWKKVYDSYDQGTISGTSKQDH